MIRQFVLAGMLISLTTRLPAEEPIEPTSRPPVSTENDQQQECGLLSEVSPTANTRSDGAGRPFAGKISPTQSLFTGQESRSLATFADQVSYDSSEFVIFDPAGTSGTGCCAESGNCFHCAHHFPCRSCNLYPCVCETSCCTTDQWICHPCQCSHGNCHRNESGEWVCNDRFCDVWGDPVYPATDVIRFGWWHLSTQGDQAKIGEYQDLNSSPFYDVDGLFSDGVTTYDLSITGTDQEANQARLKYFGPTGKADIYYQRYIRRLDHDPLSNFNLDLGFGSGRFEQAPTFAPLPDDPNNPQFQGTRTAAGSTNRAMNSQDLNVGEDYAIRVEQLNANVSGQLTDDLKYRVQFWAQRKFGERQTIGMAHCFNGGLADTGIAAVHPFAPGSGGRSCHVLGRRQEIDWRTEEIVGSVERRWENVTVEYSHTVRAFSQDDQALTRFYTGAGNAAGTNVDEWRVLGFNVSPPAVSTNGTLADYARVPENLTHFGQLKVGVELSDYRDLYTIAQAGNTHNKYRETDRNFYGFDVRLMDRSVDRFDTVTYAKMYVENNEFPGFVRYDELGPPRTRAGFVTGHIPSDIVDPNMFQPPGPQNPLDPANPFIRWLNSGQFGFLRSPLDYTRTSAGVKTRWRPLDAYSGLNVVGGYDYTQLARNNGVYEAFVPLNPANPDPDFKVQQEFDLGTTAYHTAHVRGQTQLTYNMNSYLQYTRRWIDNPLFAVHEPNGVTNSSLPTSEDLVQLGGSWLPRENLMAFGWFGIENRSHTSERADFDEDNYPIVCNIWYSPTPAWSITGGYAYFSNWIDQRITLGDQIGGFQGAGATGRIELVPVSERFSYGGRSDVISLSTTYLLSPYLSLLGGVEYVESENAFDSPVNWPGLQSFSDVIVQTQRITAGADWQPYDAMTFYVRYIYFDYNDKTEDFNSGTAHMALAGATMIR